MDKRCSANFIKTIKTLFLSLWTKALNALVISFENLRSGSDFIYWKESFLMRNVLRKVDVLEKLTTFSESFVFI